jgi:hypothetical protein
LHKRLILNKFQAFLFVELAFAHQAARMCPAREMQGSSIGKHAKPESARSITRR